MVARRWVREQALQDARRAVAFALLATMCLAGCKPGSVRTAQAPALAAPSGQVNPDAGITSYACIDGQTVTAGYPDAVTAVVTYRGHAYTLKLVPSATGARYIGYGLQWQVKRGHGLLAVLGPGEATATAPGLDCIARPSPAVAQPATRT